MVTKKQKKVSMPTRDRAVLVEFYEAEVAKAQAGLKLAKRKLARARRARSMDVACW